MFIVIFNVQDSVERYVVGPFPSGEKAHEYAKSDPDFTEWVVEELNAPAEEE